jgi:hypothetical protein
MNTVYNKQTNRPGDQTLEHDLSPSAVIVKCISIYLSYSQKIFLIFFNFITNNTYKYRHTWKFIE